MADIAVSTPNMKRALQEFTTSSNQCGTINNTLQSTIDSLRVAWSGDVAMRFQAVMTDWQERFTRVTGALHQMEDTLGRSITEYEKSNAAAADQIAAMGR